MSLPHQAQPVCTVARHPLVTKQKHSDERKKKNSTTYATRSLESNLEAPSKYNTEPQLLQAQEK